MTRLDRMEWDAERPHMGIGEHDFRWALSMLREAEQLVQRLENAVPQAEARAWLSKLREEAK